MKIKISNDVLANSLRKVLSVVSSQTTLPALNNVLVEAKQDTIYLMTTDLEVSMQAAVPATIEQEGSTTLPARKFGQIINLLPKGEVTLEKDENETTEISCEQSFFKIVGLSADEFPREDLTEEGWGFSLDSSKFLGHLRKVGYARSDYETSQTLNGILLSLRNDIMTTVGTDGRRLALMETSLSDEGVGDGDVILPSKAVTELERNLTGEGDVKVELSEARAKFSFDSLVIVTKLIEGTYPNYRQVVPEELTQSAVIPKEDFVQAINRVSLVVSDSSAAVKLNLEKGVMTVNATSSEIGESREPVNVSYEGENVELCFNPYFLADPLKYMEADQVVLQFKDEYTPMSLTGDEGFLYVLMPMRS